MTITVDDASRHVNVDVAVARDRKWNRQTRREALTGYLFILPALLGFVVFFLVPAFRALYISFTDWDLLSKARFIGLDNFRELWADPLFWNAVRVSLKYALFNIPIQMVIGLFLATVMARFVRSYAVRGVVILPYLLSNVVAAMVWIWVFSPQLGFANQLFGWLHLPQHSYFGDPNQSLSAVAAVTTWRHMGFTAILFYAGMQSIPSSIYEAARIDGASEWGMFRRITLPLLRPVGAFVFITSLVGSFQIFDTIVVATQPPGGPIDSTRALVVYINANAFGQFRMGYAASMSVMLFAFLIALSVVQLRLFRAGQSDLA
jgi:multiple sugar transport system permease protein